MSKCPLPPVDNSLHADDVSIKQLPQDFNFTDVSSLQSRPAECIVNAALNLHRKEAEQQLRSKVVDVDQVSGRNDFGIQIGHLGCFSRNELSNLERICDIVSTKCELAEEKQWIFSTPDSLSQWAKSEIMRHLTDFPLGDVLFTNTGCSVSSKAYSYLALERYIDDSVIDFFLAKYQGECSLTGSVICLPAYATTWINSDDEEFKRECFNEVFESVMPSSLRQILLPVNLSNTHWGLVVINVKERKHFLTME